MYYDIIFGAITCVAEMLGGGIVALPYVILVLSPIVGILCLFFAGFATWYFSS
jgi:hypothetical protein